MPVITPLLILEVAALSTASAADAPSANPAVVDPAPSPAEIQYTVYSSAGLAGIYSLAELVRLITGHPNDAFYLWNHASTTWTPWRQVPEVAKAITEASAETSAEASAPPPPQLPPAPTAPIDQKPEAPPPVATRAEEERLRLVDTSELYSTVGFGGGVGYARVSSWGVAQGDSKALSAWNFAEIVGDTEITSQIEQRGHNRRSIYFVLTGVSALAAVPLAVLIARDDMDDIDAGTFVLGGTGAVMALVLPFAAWGAPRAARREGIRTWYGINEVQPWIDHYNDGAPKPPPRPPSMPEDDWE